MNETLQSAACQPKHIETAQSMAENIISNFTLDLQSEIIAAIIKVVSDFHQRKLEESGKDYEYAKISVEKLKNVLNIK